ncbi:unnamed protein product [Zymoseptoria tritici ST99CH_3D1]|nr:unnamed protein product [Zymoseptoria tritici ST99CH_3D1]
MSYMRLCYWSAAEGIRHLGPRLKIEACLGDVNSILEQIRYGAVGHRHQASSPADMAVSQTDNVDPKAQQSLPWNPEIFSVDRPKLYDRIHISNIPDYTGGSLSTFLYAVPMVQHDASCYATSNCLRNPPRFGAHKHYFNEYLGGLSSDADLKKTFQVRPAIYDEQLESPLILTEYMRYHHEPTTLTSASRLPRGRLEKWLHQLFRKLAIPKDRAPSGKVLLYSPLTLTAFLRVCGHLHNVGYPAIG